MKIWIQFQKGCQVWGETPTRVWLQTKKFKISIAIAKFTVCIYTEPIFAFKEIIWGLLNGGGSP